MLKTLTRPLRSKARGLSGERRIRRILRHSCPLFAKHYTINGCLIRDRRGGTHEIDHVEIRRSGVFCIETKNIAGRLRGKADDEYWHAEQGRRCIDFRNPLQQNAIHVRALREIISEGVTIIPLAVFASDNAGSLGIPGVIDSSDLITYLRSSDAARRLGRKDMRCIRAAIEAASEGVSRREHLRSVKQRQRR